MQKTTRFALAWMSGLLAAGCGLLIGLEDRELPADAADATSSSEGSAPDTGEQDVATTDASDGGITDASDATVDACACSAGCNPEGKCLDEIVSLGMGRNHQCIVRGDGKVFCMGYNDFGQLGPNGGSASETWITVPVLDEAFKPVLVSEISIGSRTNCAISRDRDLYCWGWNAFGQTGQAGTLVVTTPTKVNLGGLAVKAVSAGSQATCAIVEVAGPAPNVRCWGHSSSGDLGLGYDTSDGGDAGPYPIAAPQTVPQVRATSVQVVDADGNRTGRACVIAETTGLPICWGETQNSEITPPLDGVVCAPDSYSFYCHLGPKVWDSTSAIAIGNGAFDVCALQPPAAGSGPNRIRCRGSSGSVVLTAPPGCGAPGGIFEVTVPDGGGSPVRMASGNVTRCFTNAQDELWCFGLNSAGQMAREGSDACGAGLYDDRYAAVPVPIALAPDGGDAGGPTLRTKLFAVGKFTSLAYTTDRRLVGWGGNHDGKLGPKPPALTATKSCSTGVNGQCQLPTVLPQPAYP